VNVTGHSAQSSGPWHILDPRPYPSRLSLVIPAYNEEEVLPLLRTELNRFAAELPCQLEMIVVNDGSRDRTLLQLSEWAKEDPRLKVIGLSRNFGHQIAATAGLDFAAGDAVVLIDADLQDPLPVIHEMIAQYRAGYDVVYGQRVQREGETVFKRVTAWAFYRLMRWLVYPDLPADTGDFRLISRRCLNGLKTMRELHRFLRGMVCWIGFPQCAVRYERSKRAAGATKYPLHKMLSLSWTAATSFSTLPLRFSGYLGVVVGILGVEEATRALVAHWHGETVQGWTSLMVVTCVVGSAILMSFGILGDYIGKLYEQAKDRPLYLVSYSSNLDPPAHER
jgi:polyisoprenyl-phosphate glycosyltransferase